METDMHEHIIGLLYKVDHSDLVTLPDLQEYIADTAGYNQSIDEDPLLYKCTEIRRKAWTLQDYADRRKSTNLHQFEFCPVCGEKIDWKAIKRRTK